MANNFDPNSLKTFFDKQFGQGSFDSGIQKAQNAARLKTQANFAKQDITKRLNELRNAAKKKTYDDAVSYWNDPANKDHLLNRGAHNVENDYLNDPRMRATIKDQGFDQQDFIDAMYNVASGGDQLSKRGFNQSQKKQNYNLSEDQQKLIPLGSSNKSNSTKTKSIQSSNQTKSKDNGVLGNLFSGLKDIGSEVGRAATAAEQFFNPFDKVSADQAVKNYLNHNQSNTFQDVARGANRAVDSASLGLMSNLDKKVNNRDVYYNSQRDFGQGGGTDMITSGLGYLVPYSGAAKLIKGTALGAKAVPTLTEGATKLDKLIRGAKVAGQLAKQGGTLGGIVTGAETGINYALNPKDQNLKDNLTNIGLGLGLGAIGDPLLRGVGAGVGKGIETAANKTMKGLLPSNERVANVLAAGLKPDPLGLPVPQLRLNAPQLQLEVPKIQPSLETLLNVGKKPNGLQNPIPTMPETLQMTIQRQKLQNAGIGFGTNLNPNTRLPIYDTYLPKESRTVIGNQADNILNDASQLQNKPSNYYENRLLDIQKEMQQYARENRKVDQWVNFAQSSKTEPKARFNFSPIDRASSLDPMHRSQTYWKTRYYDFAQQVQTKYHSNDLSQEKLQVLWEKFAKSNEPKNLHDIVDLAYGNGSAGLKNTPFNAEQRMNDILNGVKTDTSAGIKLPASRNIDELYQAVRKPDDPATFDELVRMNQLETNALKNQPIQGSQELANFNFNQPVQGPREPNLKDILNSDPRIKQQIQALFPNGSADPKISRLATLEEMVQNLESQVPPKQPSQPLEPLQFRLKTDMERQIKPKQVGNILPPLTNGAKNKGAAEYEKVIKQLTPLVKERTGNNPNLSFAELHNVYNQVAKKQGIDLNGLWANAGGIEKNTKALNGPLPPLNSNILRDGAKIENNIKQETSARLPDLANNGLKERGHIETLRNSDNAVEGLKERIKGMYRPTTNEEALTIANKYLAQGLENATSFVKSARVLKPEHVATAHRLIQELQRSGQIEKAVDIAEHIAAQGTKAGQAVQAFSIFDRLSPEGILIHANRIADRVNANLSPLQTKVTVTPDMAAKLTDLATTVEKMTNQKTVANDVINIMDKAKAGQKLTADETKQIRQFVDDAKQYIKDITPKKQSLPKMPTKLINPEVKQQIVSFLDKQEEAARKRLAQRKGRALSGLPVDDFYDYAVIGASKLAKGTLNLADFSEQMIREFGQEVAPHVKEIYDKASEMVFNETKRVTHRMSEVEKITNKAIKNGKLEPDEADNLRKFALSINNLSGDAKIEAGQELQGVLQGLERPSLLQQISTTQTIGQLLNPKTLGRNAIGNEMFYRLERLNKLVATPIDVARSKITGGQRTVTFRTNNQGEYWKNWLRGAKAGLKGVNPEGLTSQYDLYPSSFNGKWNPLKYMERALGASLKSFDYAGYKRAVNNTIGELATLRAVNEGLTGQARKQAIERFIREADDNILAIADQYGRYATFQDNNMIAVGLQKLKKGMNFGKAFGIGDLVLKYPKTPGALLSRALEYSPAGFLKAGYQIAKPWFTKGASSSVRDITENLTRALIGTGGAFGIGWFLADKGILTGKGSQDFDVNDLEKSSGKAEYSLNYDALKRWVFSGFNPKTAETQQGDKFITYNWAQPIAMSVAMWANANQNVKSKGNTSLGGAALDAGNGALDSIVGMSVLSGLQRAFTSSPGQSVGDQLMDITGQLPSSFVPTFANQIRQKSDNTARGTYDPLKTNVYKNQAINKIPGLASQLPPSYDTLGNKKQVFQGGSNNLFNVFLNPAFVSRYNPSPEAKMVLDVIKGTGDASVAPRRAQKYMMIEGKKYDLSSQQYSEYQRRLGTEVSTQLRQLNPNLSADELGTKITKILDSAGKKVRNDLKKEFFGYIPKK